MRSATFFLQIQDMHGWTSHALREWKKQDYSMIVGMVINKMWSITITGVIILPSQTMHYDFRENPQNLPYNGIDWSQPYV